ncbi:MAG: hypothetical protein MJ080_02195 [Clostridia bacterium]|nr:hypothetical protein [Clostridia bacterium]
MGIVKNVEHRFEINPLACGQAVICMLSGLEFDEVFKLVKTEKETTLKDMFFALNSLGIDIQKNRQEVTSKNDLPDIALLSLETPKCWHWSLYYFGKFYDPEYGILDDFPPSNRRYFWEIKSSI